MNYAYSWGAAVVILGTLFKLTHLPGANTMLFIGMGTEVFVFFISAFDRPFDKTQDGLELATDSQLAAEMAAQQNVSETADGSNANVAVSGASSIGGGTIIIGGGMGNASGVAASASDEAMIPASQAEGSGNTVVGGVVGGIAAPSVGAPAPAVSLETAEAMEEATTTYVERLNELNEMLLKVGALTERLSTDSQEMENLNRTLTGIARVYEMQLKSASQQITTQDEINEQTRRMASQIQELNTIYTRMIEAMTVNMPASAVAK